MARHAAAAPPCGRSVPGAAVRFPSSAPARTSRRTPDCCNSRHSNHRISRWTVCRKAGTGSFPDRDNRRSSRSKTVAPCPCGFFPESGCNRCCAPPAAHRFWRTVFAASRCAPWRRCRWRWCRDGSPTARRLPHRGHWASRLRPANGGPRSPACGWGDRPPSHTFRD